MIWRILWCVVTELLLSTLFFTSAEAVPSSSRNNEHQKQIFCSYWPYDLHLSRPNRTDIITDLSQCSHAVYYGRVRIIQDLELLETLKGNETDVEVLRGLGIKVLIGINMRYGLFEDNASPGKLGRFVQSITKFVKANHFDGLKIHGIGERGTQPLLEVVRQLSEEFQPHGLLLTAAIANKILVNPDFDTNELSGYLDWIFPSGFEENTSKTRLLDPLHFHAEDAHPELTTNWTVNYLIEKGVPSEKIIVPVITIAQVSQFSSDENVLGVPAERIDFEPPTFTKICSEVKHSNLTVVHDKRVGTYAYSYLNKFFASYNDVGDAYSLGEYIVQKNLGGGSIAIINFDDVNSECGCGRMPIFNGLLQGLRNVTIGKAENCT